MVREGDDIVYYCIEGRVLSSLIVRTIQVSFMPNFRPLNPSSITKDFGEKGVGEGGGYRVLCMFHFHFGRGKERKQYSPQNSDILLAQLFKILETKYKGLGRVMLNLEVEGSVI